MLAKTSVADLSLNELSRQIGLAKSNVLRYFETREEILLTLLDIELAEWVTALDASGISPGIALSDRSRAIGELIAASLANRPLLCELVSAQATVLERNVSAAVVLQHKRTTIASVDRLTDQLRPTLPEMDDSAIYHLIATILLMASAAWPQSRPNAALQDAYTQDSEVGAHRMHFEAFMAHTIAVTVTGLAAINGSSALGQ